MKKTILKTISSILTATGIVALVPAITTSCNGNDTTSTGLKVEWIPSKYSQYEDGTNFILNSTPSPDGGYHSNTIYETDGYFVATYTYDNGVVDQLSFDDNEINYSFSWDQTTLHPFPIQESKIVTLSNTLGRTVEQYCGHISFPISQWDFNEMDIAKSAFHVNFDYKPSTGTMHVSTSLDFSLQCQAQPLIKLNNNFIQHEPIAKNSINSLVSFSTVYGKPFDCGEIEIYLDFNKDNYSDIATQNYEGWKIYPSQTYHYYFVIKQLKDHSFHLYFESINNFYGETITDCFVSEDIPNYPNLIFPVKGFMFDKLLESWSQYDGREEISIQPNMYYYDLNNPDASDSPINSMINFGDGFWDSVADYNLSSPNVSVTFTLTDPSQDPLGLFNTCVSWDNSDSYLDSTFINIKFDPSAAPTTEPINEQLKFSISVTFTASLLGDGTLNQKLIYTQEFNNYVFKIQKSSTSI